jgi:hypothetical protein
MTFDPDTVNHIRLDREDRVKAAILNRRDASRESNQEWEAVDMQTWSRRT